MQDAKPGPPSRGAARVVRTASETGAPPASGTTDSTAGSPLPASSLDRRGRLYVVSGPSGVGKDTVLDALFASPNCPAGLVRCITATTRAPRPAEIDGRDYHFLSHHEFEARIARAFFLEHAVYSGEYYGTPHDTVEQERDAGHDVVLKIEVKGALQVRSRVPDAILVFLGPPSWQELERRLRARASDNEAKIAQRLAIAREEMRLANQYTYLVVNERIEDAVAALTSIVLAERCRLRPGPTPPEEFAPAKPTE